MARVDNTGGNGFTIDNGTGLQVRTKIQQVVDALRSIQSQSGDPTIGLGQYQLHINEVNNTSQLLKIRNKDNDGFITIGDVAVDNLGLLPKAGGTLTGVLAATSGNASAPALHFGDSTTGIFKKGTNQLGLTFATNEITFFDQNGLTINNQKELRLSEPTTAGTQYVGFKAPDTIASNVVWKLPNTDTTVSGYALISDGSGNLSWGPAAGGATGAGGDEIFWENDQTISTNYSITNGKNAGSFGPITIASGVTVTVGTGETWTVV